MLFNQKMIRIEIENMIPEYITVAEFKDSISRRTGIELDRMRLTTNDILMLDDAKLLSDYQPINEASLTVMLRDDLTDPGSINIDTYETRLQLVVTKDKTVGWLKKTAIGYDDNDIMVDPKLYRLFYDGKELYNETMTLGEIYLYKDANLILYHNDDIFRVNVQTLDGSRAHFDVTIETTVRDLKEMINNVGIDLSDCVLLHNKIVLDENNKLWTYSRSFHLGFNIKLVKRLSDAGGKVIIYYKEPDLISHFGIFVKPTNTIGEFKKLIRNFHKSIKVEDIQLRFQDEILEDDSRKLSDFHIYAEAWIEMRNRRW